MTNSAVTLADLNTGPGCKSPSNRVSSGQSSFQKFVHVKMQYFGAYEAATEYRSMVRLHVHAILYHSERSKRCGDQPKLTGETLKNVKSL